LRNAAVKRGAVVVIDPPTGDLLAAVSYPWPGAPMTPNPAQLGLPIPPRDDLVDRAFAALRPPGSTFKIVTAMAALRASAGKLESQRFPCQSQGNGRVGMLIPGFRRAVLDASGDAAHGLPDLEEAIVHSCNAYFAQLGLKMGPEKLLELTDQLGIRVAVRDATRPPAEVLAEGENLLQAGYGQGQVVATPFQMARVAATVANGGLFEPGRWVIDDSNRRTTPGVELISPAMAQTLVRSMRGVVTRGTANNIAASPLAGKTGTAQVKALFRYMEGGRPGFRDAEGALRYLDWKRGDPTPPGLRPAFYEQKQTAHGWFIGLAPFDSPRRIAFSVLVENGGSGRGAAAPIADLVATEARRLGLLP
jgi:cell division protein FtsI/penicillin-binding protein 2